LLCACLGALSRISAILNVIAALHSDHAGLSTPHQPQSAYRSGCLQT
jgi:hypothetical protein